MKALIRLEGRELQLRPGSLRVGRAEGNDLQLMGADVSSHHALLELGEAGLSVADLRSTNGSWLNGTRIQGRAALEAGDRLVLGGHELEIVEAPLPRRDADAPAPTLQREELEPVRVFASLDEAGGAQAGFLDPRSGREHRLKSELRCTLIFVLARQLAKDLERHAAEPGWVDDETVQVGLWGRQAFQQAPSTWSVLLSRTRKELEDAGFEGVLEKRRGAVRLRCTEARV